MKKIGIFYGPVGGSTEMVAKKLEGIFGPANCSLKAIGEASVSDLDMFENLIFGIATIGTETWGSEPPRSGWFSFMHELEEADIANKSIALYGLGDHIRYADYFVDSMGELFNILSKKDIEIVGKVALSDYTFKESKALDGDKFVGLPIDEEFEQSLTDERIAEWVGQLKKEFK